jgi:uncharacterized protein Smg (DUF494 family)
MPVTRQARLAALVMYRHARLSAMKLADDPNTLRIKDDATADELRAEIMEKLAIMREAGIIDLEDCPC